MGRAPLGQPPAYRVVNLEEGYPTVNVGLLRLERALNQARVDHLDLLKLIHGYGSTGAGGRLREETRKLLARCQRAGLIVDFIAGENFRTSDEATWALLKRWPSLKEDRDLSRMNRGVTLVLF